MDFEALALSVRGSHPIETYSNDSVWFIFVGVMVNLTLALLLVAREPKVRKGKTKTSLRVKMLLITIIHANYPRAY